MPDALPQWRWMVARHEVCLEGSHGLSQVPLRGALGWQEVWLLQPCLQGFCGVQLPARLLPSPANDYK